MNRMLMTWQWDDVRFFLAGARAGSGTARASALGHVTVGRRITLLERKLGVTLLNRPRMTLLQRRPARRSCANVRQWRATPWILSALLPGATSSWRARFGSPPPRGSPIVGSACNCGAARTHPELRVNLIASVRSTSRTARPTLRPGSRGRGLRTPSRFMRRSTTWRAGASRSRARDWRMST